MENYLKHLQPPDWALRTITGGRLNGKTDINPQWRIQALTESYGLMGFGWYYEITKQWLETANGETAAFVNLNLFIKIGDDWSRPIPGNGGSMFVAKEKNGLFVSDEAYKMATTDALSVACKQIGIGGAIYNGTKYQQQAERLQKDAEKKPAPPKPELPEAKFKKALESTDIDKLQHALQVYNLTAEQKAGIENRINQLKKQ